MTRDPSPHEWAEAQAVVRQHFSEGDIIRTAPVWADQGRARMFGFPFNLAQAIEAQELWDYNNLWIIADAEHADETLTALPDRYDIVQRFSPNARTAVIQVAIPEPTHVLFDLNRDLSAAQVARDYGDRLEVCDVHNEGSWYCGRIDPFLRVSPSSEEVGNSIRRCVFVGLPPNAQLRLTFSDVAFGSTIRGNVGNTMPAVRAERGSDISFRVEVDNAVRQELTFDRWDQRFHAFEVDTSTQAGERHDLAFVLHAADFFDRWVCLRAQILE